MSLVALLKYPWGHGEHALSRARVALNVPGTHSEHDVEPWEAVYVPAGQVWHAVSLVSLLKVPLAHGEHALSRARVALNVPGTHSEHVVEPWEAA